MQFGVGKRTEYDINDHVHGSGAVPFFVRLWPGGEDRRSEMDGGVLGAAERCEKVPDHRAMDEACGRCDPRDGADGKEWQSHRVRVYADRADGRPVGFYFEAEAKHGGNPIQIDPVGRERTGF